MGTAPATESTKLETGLTLTDFFSASQRRLDQWRSLLKAAQILANTPDSKIKTEVESLFKQIKQNFPLRYFYGESANAIKIQVWVTLIANLLITLLQKCVSRSWSFSGLATIVRIMLMYYIDVQGFLEHPEKDWEESLSAMMESPPEAVETEK